MSLWILATNRRNRVPLALAPLVLALLSACVHGPHMAAAGRQGQGPGQVTAIEMEPMKLEVVRGGGAPHVEAFDAATLFEQAGEDLQAQRYAEAAAGYDRLLKDFADSRFAGPALYNAGLSYEGLKQYREAAARYQQIADRKPEGKDTVDALFRLGACLAELQNWSDSLAVFDRLLGRGDLHLSDRIEALSRRGLAQVELSQLEAAERTFRETMDYFKDNEVQERLDSDFYLAMAQFYLGQIPHRYFRALPLRLPQKVLEQDMEAKARMFLNAQARYIDAIKIQNPVWATAAGYQIGSLYREMYEMLLNAPVPPELDTDLKKQVYVDLLKEKLRILLEKAKHIHEKNVQMAERIGVDNDWVRRSNESMDELERLLSSLPAQAQAPGSPSSGDGAPTVPPPDKQKKDLPVPPKRSPDYRPHMVL